MEGYPNTEGIESKIVGAITSSPCAEKLTDDEIAEMTNKIVAALNGPTAVPDEEMEEFVKPKQGLLDQFAS